MTPGPRLKALREGTRAAHECLERLPIMARLVSNDLVADEYVAVLKAMYVFHTTWEPWIAASLRQWPAALRFLNGTRSRALMRDLKWFNHAPPSPRILDGDAAHPAAALGMLYVIEGSSLGARVIARKLQASLQVNLGHGACYYDGQDAEAALERWRSVCALIEAPIYTTAIEQRKEGGLASPGNQMDYLIQMVFSANETFEALGDLLRPRNPLVGSSAALLQSA